MIVFFSCMTFADTWVLSSLSQFCAQITVTIMSIIYFSGRTPAYELISHILYFNATMLFGPLIYRAASYFEHRLVFVSWQLDEELRNWKILTSSLPVAILVAREGEVQYANQTAKKLLMGSSQAAAGFSTHSFMESSAVLDEVDQTVTNKELKEILRRVMRSDQGSTLYKGLFEDEQGPARASSPTAVEKYYLSRGMDRAPTLLAVTVTHLSLGNESSLVVALQDVSIYEQLNEEKACRQYQKVFFAMITHELRNPLQGILGIFELMMTTESPEETRKQCKTGLNTGKLMLCLIQDILDLSQLEANKFTLNDAPFSPAAAVTECMEVMEFQYTKKRLALTCAVSCPEEFAVVNDRNRYKQVILNLLGNALKFTKEGGVAISVSYNEDTRLLATSIRDTGTGLKPEELSKLFQVFGKMESNVKGNPTGVGFGLSICKRLTEAMGGSIEVRSTLGAGSEFLFTVLNNATGPEQCREDDSLCKIVDEASKVHDVLSADTINIVVVGSVQRRKMLVVDDEQVCGYVMQKLIKSLGYEAELV
ncbi:MAG: HAMP domain-containing sensor histidine kinase [Candidatus Pacebacteria bacterium]|nr:HAMP domain-containing sensor histidine kinase [Candidatus Paceibacterota bacterium]